MKNNPDKHFMKLFDPTVKHTAVWAIDCRFSCINGDPDRNNLPRQDSSTELGYITDVALKRRIRNYLQEKGQDFPDKEKYKILIEENAVINEQIERAYVNLGFNIKSIKGQTTVAQQLEVLRWLIDNYIDLRFFGGVLSTGNLKAGQYCGPVQITFGVTLDKIFPQQITITRGAATFKDENKENKTMAKKSYIPYGLYLAYIFYNPCKDKYNLVTEKDLELFWESVSNCFEINRTASKGIISTRNLWVFSHNSKLGDFPEHKLIESIKFKRLCEGVPTTYSDYEVSIDNSLDLKDKVLFTQVV